VFQIDVTKVDRDVAYVANDYTRMLQGCVLNFSSVFQKHVASVFCFGCCICFTHILQLFYLDLHMLPIAFQVF
jgi:hypothetical protein